MPAGCCLCAIWAYALASTSGCGGIYEIDVIDAATHSIVQTIPTSGYEVVSIAAHPYLPLAYAACANGGVCVIDTNTFTVQIIIPYSGLVIDVQPSPDGQWVYASEYYGYGLAKVDVSTNTIVDTLPGYGKFGLSISPDGSRIYASEAWDGVVHVIDANNMELITTIGVAARTTENALTAMAAAVCCPRDFSPGH
jgi:DNA-binding beta-propeller fold protein YncE